MTPENQQKLYEGCRLILAVARAMTDPKEFRDEFALVLIQLGGQDALDEALPRFDHAMKDKL